MARRSIFHIQVRDLAAAALPLMVAVGALAAPVVLPACGGDGDKAPRQDPTDLKVHHPQVTEDAVKRWYEGQKPDGRGNFVKGQVEYQKRNFEAALAEFRMAVELDPEKPGFWANLGLTQYQLERFAESEASLREALRLAPNWAEAYFNLALALERQGKTERALSACKRSLTLDPEDMDARKLYALLKERAEGPPPGGEEDEPAEKESVP